MKKEVKKLKTFLERIVKDIQRKWKCISKGKAHKKYEFGCKVVIVTTHKEGLCMSKEAIHKNPYDGHTLKTVANKAEINTKTEIEELFSTKVTKEAKLRVSQSIYLHKERV